uniref:C3H1-type domain-containing protein n=1 Tax=Acrobeloides nanus TaxID=290746 RepID=A0A914CQI7_9BILA
MTEEHKDNGAEEERKDICRDFLNNICNRGSRCKFYHPPKPEAERSHSEEYNFCIDFQNQGCFREHCRFIHAYSEDVEHYKRTGDITIELARAIAGSTDKKEINGIPFCKEFQNGHCSRGPNRCRYWHINLEEERARRKMGGRRGAAPPFMTPGMRRPMYDYDDYGPPSKRGAYGSAAAYPPPPAAAPSTRYVQDLERRNTELATEVESLKRELSREKERYEQLAQRFMQSAPMPVPAVPSATSWDSKYSWAS